MKINIFLNFILSFIIASCSCKKENDKEQVRKICMISENPEWILVINPSGCKTCLDQFYQKLSDLKESKGVIVLILKNSKEFKANNHFQNSKTPIYFDESRQLIKYKLVHKEDEFVLFETGIRKYKIMEGDNLLQKLEILNH